MNEENLCILIDFENIAAGTERENLGKFNTKLVMNHLKEKGRVLISRAYGDWGRFAKFKQSLLIEGVSMVELTAYRGGDKNRADIALVVDAMELIYSRPHINTFVLMSGDSDFTPLVMKLRELNKRIIGLGTRKATSRLLANACDEFIFYDNLLKRSQRDEESTDDSPTPKAMTSKEAFALLVETIQVIQRDEPRPVSAGMVKQFILRKNSTFDETDCGYSGFTDFLESAAKAELVQLVNNDKGGGYLVSIKGTAPVVKKIEAPKYTNLMAQAWSEELLEYGYHPTNHFIRHTVVHEFVDHILERRSRKKRSTLVFTYGDIARRCRKTDPTASTSEVDSILNALYKAGELYGHDQKPIRSKKINFTIKKDAEELLNRLRLFYVELLLQKHPKSLLEENLQATCELLWNDLEHLEETKAILAQLPTVEHTTESKEDSKEDGSTQEMDANKIEDSSTNTTEQSESKKEEDSSKKKATKKKATPQKSTTAKKSTKKTSTSDSKSTSSADGVDEPDSTQESNKDNSVDVNKESDTNPTAAETTATKKKAPRKPTTAKKNTKTTTAKRTTKTSKTKAEGKETDTGKTPEENKDQESSDAPTNAQTKKTTKKTSPKKSTVKKSTTKKTDLTETQENSTDAEEPSKESKPTTPRAKKSTAKTTAKKTAAKKTTKEPKKRTTKKDSASSTKDTTKDTTTNTAPKDE